MKSARRLFVPTVAVLSASTAFSVAAYASTEHSDLTAAMNLLLRMAGQPQSSVHTASDCRALESLASAEASSPLARFKAEAERMRMQSCGENDFRVGPREDSPSTPADAAAKPEDVIWDGSAVCKAGNERILQCEHRGENGRGLFVYAGQPGYENSPTLVCAHYEATYRSPFELEQQVSGRCVVTEFDWRYEGNRSDVRGIHTWLKSEVSHSPLQIPASLKRQCESVFPDALYCSPTLIVFPETDSTRVGICQLKTHDRVFGLGLLLRIGSWNSRWECESRSTLIANRDERLSTEERSCIPDHLGQHQTPFCRLPYFPVARKPLRTYIESLR